ncbi:MAG: hypothetical protein WAX69_24545 [Victivallales bacterium]
MKIKPQKFLDVKAISSRMEVNYLEKEITDLALKANDRLVDLDFNDIIHISRSAADELLSARQRAKIHDIQLIFSNLNDFNTRMLKMVADKIEHPPLPIRTVQSIPVSELVLSAN